MEIQLFKKSKMSIKKAPFQVFFDVFELVSSYLDTIEITSNLIDMLIALDFTGFKCIKMVCFILDRKKPLCYNLIVKKKL